MVVGVALALVGARTARRHAGLQRVELRRGMGIGLAVEDARGGGARVRTVEAEPDAADQVPDVVLGSASHAPARIVHVASHTPHSSRHRASAATSAISGRG